MVATDRENSGVASAGGAASKKGKDVKAGRGGKRAAVPNKADTLPSATATRVEPMIDSAMVGRMAKADDYKVRKAKVRWLWLIDWLVIWLYWYSFDWLIDWFGIDSCLFFRVVGRNYERRSEEEGNGRKRRGIQCGKAEKEGSWRRGRW